MKSSAFIRKNFRRTVLATVVAIGAFGASSSFAAEATTQATGTVIVPIAITKSADLVFGKFAANAAGTLTVSTSGARTVTGGVIPSSVGSTPAAAKFDVTGDGAATYGITWSGVTELSDGTNFMTLTRISDLTGSNATSGEVSSGTLTAGEQSIYLGGTLDVAAAQVAGDYAGNVIATVEYN